MTRGGGAPPGGRFADQAFAVAAEAYADAPGGWERAVHAAIGALFAFLARHPDQTTACVVAEWGADPDVLVWRDQTTDRFVSLLRPGFAAAETPPPPVVAQAIGGGIYELVRSHVLERRIGDLPSATPHATIVALAPFLGAEDASAIALANAAKDARKTPSVP